MYVLVIEDQRKLANNIKKALEIEGYVADAALDGAEGLRKALKNNYDLIILDLMLPKKDGIEVCKVIRKRRIQTPIIMLTARGLTKDRILGLDAGADDYLIKPFSFEELFARMRSVARRRKTVDPVTFRVADLSLNTAEREAERGGKPIRLTGKEYGLLYSLMRHAGKVLTRQQLLEHLWGSRSGSYGDSLTVYMRYLRKKIDDPYKKKLIETVKGLGYKIRK